MSKYVKYMSHLEKDEHILNQSFRPDRVVSLARSYKTSEGAVKVAAMPVRLSFVG